MKKHYIIFSIIFFLIEFSVTCFSYAGEGPKVIEMADGHHIIFPMNPEERSRHEEAKGKSGWLTPEIYPRPDKQVLEFEMAESGIMISFSLREKVTAAADPRNSKSLLPNSAGFIQLERHLVKIELSESGQFILFPASRDKFDQENHHYYSKNRQ